MDSASVYYENSTLWYKLINGKDMLLEIVIFKQQQKVYNMQDVDSKITRQFMNAFINIFTLNVVFLDYTFFDGRYSLINCVLLRRKYGI